MKNEMMLRNLMDREDTLICPPQISEVSFSPIPPRDTLVGFASFLYRGELRISDVALHVGRDGMGFSVAFPAKVLHNGARINVVYPVSREVAEAIRSAIVEQYLAVTQGT